MNKKDIVLIMLVISLALGGCSQNSKNNETTYATQNKVSSLEYGIYMNKQIQIYINQLTTRMGIARNISHGYDADNDYKLALDSVNTMQSVYDEVEVVYPSDNGDDNREDTLLAMNTAIEHMNSYAEAVKNNENLEDYIKDFENDFNQLTGLANFYTE